MTDETRDQGVVTGEVVDSPPIEEPTDPTQPEPSEPHDEEYPIDAEVEIVIEKAGVVAFTRGGGCVLLTTTSADSSKWVLPKGHREESDQTLQECALRELEEETGFIAELYFPKPIGVIQRHGEDEDGNTLIEEVTFFAGEIVGMKHDPERPLMIVEPSLAIRKLAYEDYANVVLKAVQQRAAFQAAKVVYLQTVDGRASKVN